MPLDEDPAEANHAEPRFQQRILSNVEAQSIQIGRLVQTIVYLGLPFKNRHRRFMQWLLIGVYLVCLIGGFIRLWQNGADLLSLLLLIVGSGLLSLTCLYYAWFWKPEVQDKSAPSSALPDSDERVKAQQTKQRSRQRVRRLAMVGVFAIPLLTYAGFFVWQSLPAPHVLLLVADFNGVEQQNYQVTENILRNLQNATDPYADVKVQALSQTITEQQGSEVARDLGERKKALIVIWGGYGVTSTNVQVSAHFEVLKPPAIFPDQEKIARGEAQTLALAELNSFKLQTRLSQDMSYLTLFTLGMVQYAKEDWDGAVVRFNSALDRVKEPVTTLGQETIYFYRGNSHCYKSDYKNALADYNQALKLKPDFAAAYNNRGTVYFKQGNYTQALIDYNQALKLKPDFAMVYSNRGLAYHYQGNYTQALADFNQALKLKPGDTAAYNNRGNAYHYQGNYTQALADFNQALKLKPDYAEAYSNRGNAYYHRGNYTQALADYNQALKLKPNYAEAYSNRGNAYDKQGNYTQAFADYNQALKLKPNLLEAYNNRGNAYHYQGNYTQALADFNQALKLKPDYAEAYYNRGLAYHYQGNYTQALADYNQALKLKPNLLEAYYNRGNAYYHRGNYTQALADYNQALKLKPDYAEAYINRGNAYYHRGNYTQALADYNQALKLKPDYAAAYYNKACTYSLKKEVKAAIKNLQRAIDLDAKYRKDAKTDSAFDNIREDKQFRVLVGQ